MALVSDILDICSLGRKDRLGRVICICVRNSTQRRKDAKTQREEESLREEFNAETPRRKDAEGREILG